MNINVRTNISKEFDDNLEIVINASEYTKEVENILQILQQVTSAKINSIVGRNGNEIAIIDVNDIIKFYSSEKYNYCKTKKGEFTIKQKLYELEETLPTDNFIRISNSCIVNIKYIECFDLGIIGNILVKFKDGSTENVSKRKVSEVMRFLKERR